MVRRKSAANNSLVTVGTLGIGVMGLKGIAGSIYPRPHFLFLLLRGLDVVQFGAAQFGLRFPSSVSFPYISFNRQKTAIVVPARQSYQPAAPSSSKATSPPMVKNKLRLIQAMILVASGNGERRVENS